MAVSSNGSSTLEWSNSGGGGASSLNLLSDVLIGNNSIYIGDIPGSTTSSERNTSLGTEVLGSISGGDDNVAIGYQAGNALTTGIQNTILGSKAGFSGTNNLLEIIIL